MKSRKATCHGPRQARPGATKKAVRRPTTRSPPTTCPSSALKPWDRYQTLSGLQFYFDTEFQLVHGHVYYTDSPWALSSINRPWSVGSEAPSAIPGRTGSCRCSPSTSGTGTCPRPSVPQNGPECPRGEPAKDCSPDEIAHEVWRQITTSLGNDMPREPAQTFPTPVWYTLDRSFKVAAIDKDGKPATRLTENRAPYLVPIVSDWHNRPGGDPWNPHHSSISYRRVPREEGQGRRTSTSG